MRWSTALSRFLIEQHEGNRDLLLATVRAYRSKVLAAVDSHSTMLGEYSTARNGDDIRQSVESALGRPARRSRPAWRARSVGSVERPAANGGKAPSALGPMSASTATALPPHAAKNFVNGEWRFPQHGYEIDVHSPTTIEDLGAIPRSAPADVEQALDCARAALRHDLRTIVQERLERFCAEVRRAAADIGRLEHADSGVSRRFAETAATLAAAQFETLHERPADPDGRTSCCAHILPAYAPFWLYCSEVFSALLAGNACVMKPSSVTPLTAALFAEFVADLDLPPGAFALIQGTGVDAGTALARSPKVDRMIFVGGRRAAGMALRGAAEALTACSATVGNLNPSILYADGDIDEFVGGLGRSLFVHAGQAGFASRWCLVPKDASAAVFDKLGEAVAMPDEADCSWVPAPLVSEHRQAQAESFLSAVEQRPGKSLVGGRFRSPRHPMGYFFRPSILVDPSDADLRRGADLPAPVLFLSAYESEEALHERLLQFHDFGALHLFSRRGIAALPTAARRLHQCLSVNGDVTSGADAEHLWHEINNLQRRQAPASTETKP